MTTPTIQTDTIRTLCARIQAAAIKCDTMHVFVDYAPHVQGLSVRVHPVDTIYEGSVQPEYLLYEAVYLDAEWSDPVDRLTAIVDKLQRLGVEV